jgi:hypothetical protein
MAKKDNKRNENENDKLDEILAKVSQLKVGMDEINKSVETYFEKTHQSESKDKSTESVSDDAQSEASDDKKDKRTSAETQSEESSGEQQQKKNKKSKDAKQQKQQKFKVVGRNDNGSPFSASGEFTEEQLVKMYRQMQADRARAQQLFNHVTSPYTMRGSAGESMAMAAGAFVGFALGRTMYKASRIGHLRQDWRLRREVLRQERGYYNQGTQSRFGGILSGFSNAASSFRQGWQRGRRKDINMDVQPQASEKVEVEAAAEPTENMPTNEPNYGIA